MNARDRLLAWNRRRTTDVYFVGYPKMGNTWSRFLVGHYLQELSGLDEPPLFDGYDTWGRCQRSPGGPAMHFTHAPLVWDRQTAADLDRVRVVLPFAGRPVALIVRPPLDALLSMWMQARHQVAVPFSGDFPAFLAHPVHGLDKLLRFHMLWAQEVGRPEGLHVLRYEDLRTNTVAEFRALLAFLGIEAVETAVERAVARSSFENMQRMESTGEAPRFRSSGLPVFATGDREEPNAFHVRRGGSGEYREHLPEALAKELEARVQKGFPSIFAARTERTA